MRLVHLADIHLGFRQYLRQTPTGINQREADVGVSLRNVINKVIELKPDLVLLAGDVFHAVRPSNPAILHAFQQFARLREMLPDAHVVMVAGNHDTPRTAETGCILRLFAELGITVADKEAKRITIHEHDVSILAVPDLAQPPFDPDPNAKYNILLLHAEIMGILPRIGRELDRRPLGITLKELGAERWNYVALGHYHVYKEIAPNAYYSGALDYTSTNSWGELAEDRKHGGKGIIERDLETGAHTFHPVPPRREWLDLPAISGEGLSPASLDEEIRSAVEKADGGIDDKVVRLVVRDVPRHILRELDHKAIREYKKKALAFYLDTRRPEMVRQGQAGPGRRASLADTVRDKLQSRPLTENINREALVELGLHYLREADLVAGPAEEDAIA
jgi:DNA repair exonuclease SbcCD nuclease subunit